MVAVVTLQAAAASTNKKQKKKTQPSPVAKQRQVSGAVWTFCSPQNIKLLTEAHTHTLLCISCFPKLPIERSNFTTLTD